MAVFIYVIENTLSAALLCALAAVFLLREGVPSKEAVAGRKDKPASFILAAFLSGLVLSLIITVLRRSIAGVNLRIITAQVRGLSLAASVIATLLLWGNKNNNKKTAALIRYIGAAALIVTLLAAVLPAVFLYSVDFRAVEESALNTAFFIKWIFYAAAFLFVGISAAVLYRAGRVAPLNSFRIVFSAALFIQALYSVTIILQLLLARRIIPFNITLFKGIAFSFNHSMAFTFLTVASVVLLLIVVLVNSLFEKSKHDAGSRDASRRLENPAQRRKFISNLRKKRRFCVEGLVLCAASFFTLTSLKTMTERGVELSPAEEMQIAGGEILIPLEQVSDGHLHRFVWTASEGIEVRFIIIKKNETSFGVGLDACDICGPTGYYERKSDVICMLCDVVMNKNTIGFKGGCNPVPLEWTMREGRMIIQCGDLNDEQHRFR